MIGGFVGRRFNSTVCDYKKFLQVSCKQSIIQQCITMKKSAVPHASYYSTFKCIPRSLGSNCLRKSQTCSIITLQGNVNTYSTETDLQKKTTALTIVKDLQHLGSAPTASLVLGLGGLVPFMSAPAYMLIAGYYSPFIAFGQVAYGATILAFLGGIRWGITIPEEGGVTPNWFNIGYSVTPSLIAWVGLLFPVPVALVTLIVGIGGTLYMDLVLPGYPPWFRALRFLLTSFAVLALWTTLVLRFTLDTHEVKKVKTFEKLKKEEEKAESKVTLFTKTKNVLDEISVNSKNVESKIEKITEAARDRISEVRKIEDVKVTDTNKPKLTEEEIEDNIKPMKDNVEEVKEIKG